MPFRLRLNSLNAETSEYEPLRFFASHHDARGRVTHQVDPIGAELLGDRVEYGPLFAYLFRRFGAPNAVAAPERLVRYVLSTPMPDMALIVEPTIAGLSVDVFSFRAPPSVRAAADRFLDQRVAESVQGAEAFWGRDGAIRRWLTDDPLRPYALAADRTLRDLLRPVYLEEAGAIDIFGDVPRTAKSVRPAAPALGQAVKGSAAADAARDS